MVKGFEGFKERMKERGERVVRNANQLKRKAALACDAAVVLATPVDTGRARSNWQASLNAPAGSTIEPYATGSQGSSAGQNAQAAIEQGKGVIGQAQSGDGIYITNNLPYIGRLNDGYSAQAPAGFVQEAVLVGINAIKKDAGKIVDGDIS